ncbi:ABC transporter permease [Lentilactobacillus sp. Marseille-Q4993]|uniref:ABC transporter permease n=1 Tax=Lentilactobacillus sp. Marseille-Q4993 TaxID=3039492 RepID=UPI0024BBF092|nr:ABC transporter permease [Lentilactobacillus sp. Marseille-Q4993]
MKIQQTSKLLFKRQISLVGWMYLWAIGILIILPFVLSLLTGTLNNFNWRGNLQADGVVAIFSFFIFAISALTYENFKLLIQNGISRRTFFISQLYVLIAIAAIGAVANVLYGYLTMPLTGVEKFDTYLNAYGGFFTNDIVSFIANLIFTWLTTSAIAMTGMAVGSFLSLFSKRLQRLILIAGPIVAFVTLMFVARSIASYSLSVSWVADFVKFIIGYAKTGPFNPFPFMGANLIWAVAMASLSKYFFSKKQLKRE